jgi:hypothetical protein
MRTSTGLSYRRPASWAERLLQRACSLVLAPPWVGKSFVARQIADSLRPATDGEGGNPDQTPYLFHRSDLDERMLGEPFEPPWWCRWRESDRQAIWVIDALEVGQRRELSLCPRLLGLVEELGPERWERLRLVAFAREGELQQLYPRLGGEAAGDLP